MTKTTDITAEDGHAPHAFAKGAPVRYRDQGRLADYAAVVVGLRGHNQFGDPCYLLRLEEAAPEVDIPERDGVKGIYSPALTAGQEIGAHESQLKVPPPPADQCACANCDWRGPVEDAEECRDFWSRVEPGDTVPAGDCPECGAFVFMVKDVDPAATLLSLLKGGFDISSASEVIKDFAAAKEPHLTAYRDAVPVRDGELECDSNAIVSHGDDGGAYVQTWTWVSDEDAGVEADDAEEDGPGAD